MKGKNAIVSTSLMSEPHFIVKKIEIDEAIIGMRNDGIVHVYFKTNAEIDMPTQLKLVNVYNELTNKIKHPFIFEAGDYCSITKEARDNGLFIESISPANARAIIAQNTAHKLIADFYLRFNKPKNPYKVFDKFNGGINWLKTLEGQPNQEAQSKCG